MGSDAVNLLDKNLRKSGVLAHPTSFPSPYGIGDLGEGAYKFIDFLPLERQYLSSTLSKPHHYDDLLLP